MTVMLQLQSSGTSQDGALMDLKMHWSARGYISHIRKSWSPFHQHKQEVLWRTNRLLSLIRHGQHWKRRVQQFFYRRVWIRYRGNVSTEPLPSKDRGIFTEPLPRNDKGIFTEPLPSNDRGNTETPAQTATLSHKPSRLKRVTWKIAQFHGNIYPLSCLVYA
jgi:hypothetical protein